MKFWLFLISLVIAVSCAGDEPKEPVAGDPNFAGIDPDQKAAPKDQAVQPTAPSNDAGSATPAPAPVPEAPPAASSAVEPAPPQPEQSPDITNSVPPPTPPVSDVVSNDSSQSPPAEQPAALQESSPPASSSVGSGPQVRYIKAFEMNIRSQPNRHSKIVGRLKGGEEVHVSIHGGWSKLDDGRWIRTRWLVKSPPDKLVSVPPDEEGRPQRSKKSRHNKKSKRSPRGAKS